MTNQNEYHGVPGIISIINDANTGKFEIDNEVFKMAIDDWKISSSTSTYAWPGLATTTTTSTKVPTGNYYLQNWQYEMPITTAPDAYDLFTGGPRARAVYLNTDIGTSTTINIDFTPKYIWSADTWVLGDARKPADRLREIIQQRCGPHIITSKSISRTQDIREIRARETLRRVLGDKQFMNFMKKGFVSVKAKSGLIYQIFPGHGITNVYNNGKKIERLCVVFSRSFADTDSLIMRYLLILNNEERFRSLAISHGVYSSGTVLTMSQTQKSLVEIYKEIKGIAA